jgi:hypothetical protein
LVSSTGRRIEKESFGALFCQTEPAYLRSKKAELSGGSGITTAGTHLNLSGGIVYAVEL